MRFPEWLVFLAISQLSIRIEETRCSYSSGFILDCSNYAATSTNTTMQQLGWNARLHACFADNPYDTFHLPLPYSYGPLTLYYDYIVVYVIQFEETRISLMGQLSLEWEDHYRMWDTNEIPLGATQVPVREIWYPQFNFISSVKKRSQKLIEPDDIAVLFPNFVSLIRENVVEGHCNVDYYRFPFDEQICVIEFELERYFFYEDDLFIVRLNYTYEFQSFENEEWKLMNVVTLPQNIAFKEILVNSTGYKTDIVEDIINHAKTGFQVNITLRRYSQFYVVNVLVPIIILTVIGQTAFAIPEHSDGKIVVPLTVLLGFMFVQGIVATELPRSEKTPSIAIYVLTCILLSGISILCCAICMWIAHMKHTMPRFVHAVVLDAFGFLLFPSHWIEISLRLWHRRCRVTPPDPSGTQKQASNASCRPTPTSTELPLEPVSSTEEGHSVTNSSSQDVFSQEKSNAMQRTPSMPDAARQEENGQMAVIPQSPGGDEEWPRAAQVVNRLFGLLHIAAIFICFFVLVFPLLLSQ